MTAAATLVADTESELLQVQLISDAIALNARLTAAFDQEGISCFADTIPRPGTVLLAAGITIDSALDACPFAWRPRGHPLLVAADVVSPAGMRRAVHAGIRTVVHLPRATPGQMTEILRSAMDGGGRLPYGPLIRLLSGLDQPEPVPRLPEPAYLAPLTARQLAVLRLMADGHGNSSIARTLACSEHTVKNIIYDLMGRLQARNRAHAVAHAVRSGLI